MTLDNVIYVSLSDALEDSNSPYHACSDYTSYFQKYGQANNRKLLTLIVSNPLNLKSWRF